MEVKLREVAPRDGFQSITEFIPTEKKLEVIEAIAQAGVQDIKMTSFLSPKSIPQLRDAAEGIRRSRRKGVIRSALVPNRVGAQNAIESGVNEIVVLVSATEAHNEVNVRRRIEKSLSDLDAISALAIERGIALTGALAVAFGCPYQGDVPEENVSFEVFHYTQVLGARAKKLSGLSSASGLRVTYHDPCYLGRHNQEYQAPRGALKSVPGLQLVEMGRVKGKSFCCGGGGGNFFTDLLGGGQESPARARVREAAGTGASVLAVACPNCARMLEDAVKVQDLEGKITVKEISEIIQGPMQA